jgi:ankyrin repeat protein
MDKRNYIDELDDFEWLYLDYCKNGNLEGIKKIIEYIESRDEIHAGFSMACYFKNIDIIKFLLSIDNKIDLYYDFNGFNSYFNTACNTGNLEIIELLYPYYKNKIEVYEKGFLEACKNGKIEVAQLVYSKEKFNKDSFLNDIQDNFFVSMLEKNNMISFNIYNKAFLMACTYGHIDIAKWLLTLDEKPDIHYDIDINFSNSCMNGHLEIAKWLLTLDNKIDIHNDDNSAFISACCHGRLDVAKWLYSLDKFDIYEVFVSVCESEQLEDDNLNIHAENEGALRKACEFSRINIIKWLYSLDDKPDIRFDDDYIFKKMCEYKNIWLLEYLVTLCDDYQIEIEDGILKSWNIKNELYHMLENKEYRDCLI